MEAVLKAAKTVETVDEARLVGGDAVIFYSTQEQYERLTERSGMLREWKVGFEFPLPRDPKFTMLIATQHTQWERPILHGVPQYPFLRLAPIRSPSHCTFASRGYPRSV